jgi:PGF-pre-PGF domain-containing protein
MRKEIKIGTEMILVVAVLLILVGNVSALSMPLSVKGTVFDLENGEQISERVHVSVNDTDSGFYVEGMTGTFYNPGRYAASVYGEEGDNVIITVWNNYHSESIVVTLAGSVTGADLYLNMTPEVGENHPPEIISEPITMAYTGVLYRYDVEADDSDGDILEYSLTKKPQGMFMDGHTGLIEWVPRFWQVGKHKVIVRVEDGRGGNDTQEFVVRVRLFPWWSNNAGHFNVSNIGLFLKIIPFEPYGIKNPEIVLKELTINEDVEVDEIYVLYREDIKKPSGTRTAARKVYNYMQLYPLNVESSEISNVSIEFRVSKDWFDKKNIKGEHIVLLRYVNGYWYPIETVFVGEDQKNAFYRAESDGMGYFAIVERKTDVPLAKKSDSPYFIVGTVYESDGETQVDAGMPIVIENLDDRKRVELETGIGPLSGSYAVIVPGDKGDMIVVTVDGTNRYSFNLKNYENNIDFVKKRFTQGYSAKVRNDGEGISEALWEYLRGLFGGN